MQTTLAQHVEFRPKRSGHERPFIRGTRVEVLSIVVDSEVHGMSAEEIARGYDNVSLADVYAALTFYHDNRDLLRQMLREDEEWVEQQRRSDASGS